MRPNQNLNWNAVKYATMFLFFIFVQNFVRRVVVIRGKNRPPCGYQGGY